MLKDEWAKWLITFTDWLKMMEIKEYEKLEKSRGLNVCNATINTRRETKRLEVNKMSSNHGLSGITIMAIKIIIPIGILKVLTSSKIFCFSSCFNAKSILSIHKSKY